MFSSPRCRNPTRTALALVAFILLNAIVAITVISRIPREMNASIHPSASHLINQQPNSSSEKLSIAHFVDEIQALKHRIQDLESSASQSINQSVTDLSQFGPSFKPWLIIGIPTVGRPSPDSIWYLNATLHSIANQLADDPNDPLFNQVHVVIMNNASPEQGIHTMFEECQKSFAHRSEFHFLTNPGKLVDDKPSDRDLGTPDLPGWKVRKQTRDIAALLEAVVFKSHYYLFMEDDFTLCPHFILQLRQMIYKANRLTKTISFKSIKPIDPSISLRLRSDFFSIRLSYGMNGYLIHNDEDAAHLYEYLLRKQRSRPPDHLMAEWNTAEQESISHKQSRPHFAYRYNLLEHLGTISSLRSTLSPKYPSCWHELKDGVVCKAEAFDKMNCEHDDMSPCASQQSIKQSIDLKSRSQYIPPPFHISDSDIDAGDDLNVLERISETFRRWRKSF